MTKGNAADTERSRLITSGLAFSQDQRAAELARIQFWSDQVAWPADQAGHKFLARVVLAVGEKLFGEHWTGREGSAFLPALFPERPIWHDKWRAYQILEACRPDPKRLIIKLSEPVAGVWHEPKIPMPLYLEASELLQRIYENEFPAVERFVAAVGVVDAACMTGKLLTARRAKTSGQFTSIEASAWGRRLHFGSCEIHPIGGSGVGVGRQWIFVTKESADLFLSGAPVDAEPTALILSPEEPPAPRGEKFHRVKTTKPRGFAASMAWDAIQAKWNGKVPTKFSVKVVTDIINKWIQQQPSDLVDGRDNEPVARDTVSRVLGRRK